MSFRSGLSVVICCVLTVLVVCPASAWAQRGRPGIPGMGGIGRSGGTRDQRRQQQQQLQQQQQQQLQKLPVLETSGTIEAVGPGMVQVLSAAKQPWVLQVLPNATCQLTGKAKAEFLGPGLFVRFVAEVNKRRGTVDEKITKLTIFTPSQFRQPGAEPDLGAGSTFGDRTGAEKKADEAPKPTFGAGAAPSPALGGGAGKRSGPGAKGDDVKMFDVRGQITAVSNGKATIHVPNVYFKPLLRVEIAEDADIDVELDDPAGYTLARKGDKVQARGRQTLGNQGFAEDLQIELASPLGASEEPKKAHARGTARAKRGAEAGEAAGSEPGAAKGEKQDDEPAAAQKKLKKTDSGKTKPAGADKAPDAKPVKDEAK